MLSLNEKLKALREEKGLSQEELALKLNVVRQTVSKWEKGLSAPDAEMLVKLAAVFETSVGALLDEEQMHTENEGHESLGSPCESVPKRKSSVLSIVLLAVGSPVWVPLAIAAVAVALALYIVIWACVISLWAVFVSLGACAVSGIAASIALNLSSNGLQGLAMMGAGLVCAGLAILAFFGCKAATKCVLWLSKRTVLNLKKRLTKKEGAQ